MHSREFRTLVLVFSVIAVLGVMAATAVSAEAGEFRIENKTFTQRGISSETFVGTIGQTEFTVEWLGFGIDCGQGTLKGTLHKGGAVDAQAQFQECFVPEFEAFCTVEGNKLSGPGKITIQGSGEIVLHGGKHYVKFASANFTTIYTTGVECPLLEAMVASGSAAIKIPFATEELVKQQFSAVTGSAEVKLLEVEVRCAGEPAAILGSGGTVELAGANAGKAWGLE